MIFSMIVLIFAVAVIAVIFLIIAGSRVKSVEGGEQVIKNVYVYLVLFATLMMIIGGSVAAFMAIADLIVPPSYHQTFEEYKRWGIDKEVPDQATLTEEELKARYDEMVAAHKIRQTERAKNSLIKSLGWIIIPLPIFLYFQRRLAKNGV